MKNNNKDITISIKSSLHKRGEQPTKYEFITEGLYVKKGDTTYLSYDESELMEHDSKAVLIIRGDEVKLKRFGHTETTLVFKENHRHISKYKTPYLSFNVEILTEKVDINVTEDSGNIDIDYTLSTAGDEEVFHKLNIRY